MFRKILVAVDGSVYSRRAIETAVDMAQHYQSEICLLHAFPHVSDFLGTPFYESSVESRTLHGMALLESARTQIGDRAPVTTQLLEGSPADAVLRVAEVEGYDLIVIGSRGHSQVMGLLLGSVSTSVAQRAACPVLIVHEPR